MAVNFYLEKRLSKQGEAPIRCSITIQGKRLVTTTSYSISPEFWNVDGQKVLLSASVRKKENVIAVTNVHIGSLGDILTMPIDIAPELQITQEELLDAILGTMSHGGFDEAEQTDFWNEMTNLQKAKILR